MKILVDALSARFGGLATYVEGLAKGWTAAAPDDDLHVALADGSPVDVGDGPTVTAHRVRVGRPPALRGPVARSTVLPRMAAELGADVMLCVIPTVPVGSLKLPLSVVVHDLRHELLPNQFPVRQRILRRFAYGAAYRRANSLISVSERTKGDLLRLHPDLAARAVTVIPHGADHVDAWPRAPRTGHALAFGHTHNKRPQLVLDAWNAVRSSGADLPQLHIVGLDERAREACATVATRLRLMDRVTTHPFLPSDQFRRLLTGAGLVVFPTDFEGFGLPVLEAMKLGIPVVVGPDDAVAEVAGGHAFTASALEAQAIASAVRSALAASQVSRDAARRHAEAYTWSRTARMTRVHLAEVIAAARRTVATQSRRQAGR